MTDVAPQIPSGSPSSEGKRQHQSSYHTTETLATEESARLLESLPNETRTHICELLADKSLTTLARCSCSWKAVALHVLYKRDARAPDRKSRALCAAVKKGCAAKDDLEKKEARKIWEVSLLYASDINGQFGSSGKYDTPLGIAAAGQSSQNLLWTKFLLQKGASPSIESKRVLTPKKVDLGIISPRYRTKENGPAISSLLRALKEEAIGMIKYSLPMLFPILQSNKAMCNLFFADGRAGGRLAWGAPLAADGAALTAIHVLAMSGCDPMDMAEDLLQRFRPLIDASFPSTLYPRATALHLAVLSLNNEVLPKLLGAGANVDAEMGPLRKTPLQLAINQMKLYEDKDNLEILKDFVQDLLATGAAVNRPLPVGTGYTPLMALLETMKAHSKWPKAIKDTMQILFDHGADSNVVTLGGTTAVSILADISMSELSQKQTFSAVQSTLETLVNNHAADLNLHTVGSSSLLGRVFERHSSGGSDQIATLKLFYKHGARFTVDEANEHFKQWLPGSELRTWYNMKYHRDDIRQDLVNLMYTHIFEVKNSKAEFDSLKESLGTPTKIAYLLWMTLQPSNYNFALFNELSALSLDGNGVHPKHQVSLVGRVVRNAWEQKCSATQAIRHIKALSAQRATFLHVDKDTGLTPIDYLERQGEQQGSLKGSFETLLLELFRAREIEQKKKAWVETQDLP